MIEDRRAEYFREATRAGLNVAQRHKKTASGLHQKAKTAGHKLASAAAWEAIEWANRAEGHYMHANALGWGDRDGHKTEANGAGALKRCEESLAKAQELLERGE
ncbi:hypothetical protein [Endobacterium cereale]|uniref:hypothetical protein n=1 Tax=Endobacterium cereale TaxID=2663029 RepID=UPI002B46A038|nr:hypothetical protein [Endobacterium cereale]MEB2843784.1 hypothetical protein [Endobacterium cereale]